MNMKKTWSVYYKLRAALSSNTRITPERRAYLETLSLKLKAKAKGK